MKTRRTLSMQFILWVHGPEWEIRNSTGSSECMSANSARTRFECAGLTHFLPQLPPCTIWNSIPAYEHNN
jgi:hypothetical protein